MKFLKRLFTKKKSIYSTRIFEQPTWLETKVQDALWDARYETVQVSMKEISEVFGIPVDKLQITK